MGLKLALKAVVLLYITWTVQCTHFRGMIIQWAPDDPTITTGDKSVTFTHRISWRRDASEGGDCDATTIQSGTLLGDGDIECIEGCTGDIGSTEYRCTDFSETDNWSAGEGNNSFTFDGSTTTFSAQYSSNAWLTSLQIGSGSAWRVVVSGDLSPRTDNGLINSSPRTAVTPIVRLQRGCERVFQIPVEDPDGDEVRCRLSTGDECTGTTVCNGFPHANLTAECSLEYGGQGAAGLWPVIIQIEDFITADSTTVMSSVPVQFLVELFDSDVSGDERPEFVGITPPDDSCIAVPFGTTFMTSIVANVTSNESSIVEFVTVSPIGLMQSPMPIQSPNDPLLYFSNITWTSQPNQQGINMFCYRARDSNDIESEQFCITLLGGVSGPQVAPSTVSPTGVLDLSSSSTVTFIVEFDQMIDRPSSSRFIMFYDNSGSPVLSIDALSSGVTYSSPRNNTGLLSFTVDLSQLQTGEEYYILLDTGVAVGTEFCNQESLALTDTTVWTFSTDY